MQKNDACISGEASTAEPSNSDEEKEIVEDLRCNVMLQVIWQLINRLFNTLLESPTHSIYHSNSRHAPPNQI